MNKIITTNAIKCHKLSIKISQPTERLNQSMSKIKVFKAMQLKDHQLVNKTEIYTTFTSQCNQITY